METHPGENHPDLASPTGNRHSRRNHTNWRNIRASAVAPLWAGLIARINATKASPVGFINPALYSHPGALRDITNGNNGTFAAAAGWDACTGLGSPNGQKVADAI
jgi:hypothetical protein